MALPKYSHAHRNRFIFRGQPTHSSRCSRLNPCWHSVLLVLTAADKSLEEKLIYALHISRLYFKVAKPRGAAAHPLLREL